MKTYNALCLFVGFTAVVLLMSLSCKKTEPPRVSIGTLSTKSEDHTHRKIIVTNASGGQRHGRFVVFKPALDSHYDVVFVLVSTVTEVDSTVTCFSGVCEGVRVTELPGCPCDTPFVLVTSVEPGSSANTD